MLQAKNIIPGIKVDKGVIVSQKGRQKMMIKHILLQKVKQ